jgi:hypothetical protein
MTRNDRRPVSHSGVNHGDNVKYGLGVPTTECQTTLSRRLCPGTLWQPLETGPGHRPRQIRERRLRPMPTERGPLGDISNRVLRIRHIKADSLVGTFHAGARCELGRIGGSSHEKSRRIFAPRFRVSNTGADGPSSTPGAIGRDGPDLGAACRGSQGQN